MKHDKTATGLDEATATALAAFVKETIGERVGEVRVSKRLVGSPAVAVNSDNEMSTNMRRVLRAMGREQELPPEPKPDLELNPDHALIVSLEKMRHTDAALASQVAEQVLDQALVSANLLEDPRMMLNRMTTLLEKLLTEKASV